MSKIHLNRRGVSKTRLDRQGVSYTYRNAILRVYEGIFFERLRQKKNLEILMLRKGLRWKKTLNINVV